MSFPEESLLPVIARALAEGPSDMALYQRLAGAVEQALAATGAQALPSERRLAAALGVSRVTLRRALDLLARDGRLRRQQGAATRVTPRQQKTLSTITGFSEDQIARGAVPGQRWISRQTVLPTPQEALALGLSPQEPVVRMVRLRLSDGTPLAIERAAVPQALLPGGELVETSLYAALRALGVAPVRGAQRIRAGLMGQADAALLDSEPGAPLLIIERRCTLDDGRPVEFTETRYNGLLYDFLTGLGD